MLLDRAKEFETQFQEWNTKRGSIPGELLASSRETLQELMLQARTRKTIDEEIATTAAALGRVEEQLHRATQPRTQ
jgi:hypothetical protein